MFSQRKPSRKQASSIALAVAASLGAAALARANTQTFVWTDIGLSNDWADAADWSPTGVPDNGNLGISDFNVIIPNAFGPCTAMQDFTVDSVSVNTGGILNIGIGGSAGSVVGNFTDNGLVTINRDDSALTFANSLAGSGQLTVTGGGTVTFTGVNSFNGQLTINAGATAVLGSSDFANLFGSNTVNGKLDIGGQSPAMGLLSGSGTVDNISAGGAPTLYVGYSDLSSTFAGVIANTSGVVSLSKEGGGTLYLTGFSTYSGVTTIDTNGGAIHFSSSGNILHTQQITELSAAGIILGNHVTLANPIQFSVGSGEFVQVDPGASATLSGPVTMIGGGGDQYRLGFPNSTGTLTVTGVNAAGSSADPTTFPSTLSAGVLSFITEGNIVFAATGGLYCNPGANVLGLGRSSVGLNLAVAGSSTVTSYGSGGAALGSSFADPSVTVTIQDRASMNLGAGPLNLASQTAAFTNTLNLNGGAVTTGGLSVSATAATLNASSVTVNFNGGVVVAGAAASNFFPASSSMAIHFNVNDGGLLIDTNAFAVINNSPVTLASAGSGTKTYPDGGLTKLGLGELIFGPLAGTSATTKAYQGPTSVSGGLLDLNSGAQLPATAYIQVNAGAAAGTQSGSTQDAAFLHLLTVSAFNQAGGFAVAPADSQAAENLDFSGTLPLELPGYNTLTGYGKVLNMTAISNGMGTTSSLSGMSVAAVSGVGTGGTGAAASAVAYTGSITPGKNAGQITYQLGGGGTLQLTTVLSGINSTPARGGTGNGTPLVDFGGKTSVLAENGGAVLLTTTNTYTGITTINGVVVQAIPAADLPVGSTAAATLEQTILAVQFLGDSPVSTEGGSLGKADPTVSGNLVINGGILKYIGSGDTTNRLFTIGALGATLDGSGAGLPAAVDFQNTSAEAIAALTAPVALTLTGTYGSDAPGSATNVNVLKGKLVNGAFPLSLVKSGPGAWEVTNTSNTYTGGTVVNAGVLQLGGPGTILGGTSAPLTVNSGGVLDLNGNSLSVGVLSGTGTIDNVSAGGNLTLTTGAGSLGGTFAGAITNTTGTVSLLNVAGTLVLSGASSYSGTTKISGGTLAVASPTALPGGTQVIDNATLLVNAGTSDAPIVLGATGTPGIIGIGTLTVGQVAGATGYAQLASGSGASTVSVLNINSGSTLDIASASLVINYGTAANDPRTAVRADLQSGYAGGIWTGTGLTSSAVAAQVANAIANGGGVWAIGYADGGKDLNQTVAVGNQLVVRPALVGDANLDGNVTFIDLGIVAQNLGATNSDWEHGDFNYDGSVNFLDIGLLAQNLNKNTLNTPLDELIPDPSAALTAQWNLAVAEIQANNVTQPADLPEPGMVGLLATCAGGLLARRRKVGGGLRRGCRAGTDAI